MGIWHEDGFQGFDCRKGAKRMNQEDQKILKGQYLHSECNNARRKRDVSGHISKGARWKAFSSVNKGCSILSSAPSVYK